MLILYTQFRFDFHEGLFEVGASSGTMRNFQFMREPTGVL